jgi:hypothetical protein
MDRRAAVNFAVLAAVLAAGRAPDAAGAAEAEWLDLSSAVVVAPPERSRPEENAVVMLLAEVEKRSQVRWRRAASWPDAAGPVIAVAAAGAWKALPGKEPPAPGADGRPEGFRIRTETRGGAPLVWVSGNDARGVLYGVGRLLRALRIERRSIRLPAGFAADAAPRTPLRGHQLGYRPKTNSYDGWTAAMWEDYIRDLVVFGANAIELIPPRSDDVPDSPHFPMPQMEMMVAMSRLAADYGLAVWIWYPALDRDYADPATVEFALEEWGEVFRKLPRVDAIFVPGGDPGHTRPMHLLALLEKQAQGLRRFHPRAELWVSPQSFTREWLDEFLALIASEPAWLSGIVHGPQVRVPIAELRQRTPKRYPIRDYPDITHSRHCQYPVPDWDLAFALTEGREPINPRPMQMARIFRAASRPHTIGFITYSEGSNDDVNKCIWSALGWDPDADVREVLREYSRYFIGPEHEAEFAEGLLALEENWRGPALSNEGIEATWRRFEALEKRSSPRDKLNWRFQQALYRATYDAYVQRRLAHETGTEEAAMALLRQAPRLGARRAMEEAERAFERPLADAEALALRARLFEIAEALFQSIRMQLSVERYAGMAGRGNSLDDVDQPLNNRLWLKHRFAAIRGIEDEARRLDAIDEIVRWTDPGPGGFYDDLGDPARQPHLLRGAGWEDDPGFYATPQVGFTDRAADGAPLPISWWTSAESLYDAPLRMRYRGLDKAAAYKLRVVYGRYRNAAAVRLLADETIEVHPYLKRDSERLDFDVPPAATADGELTLTWLPTPGLGGNGRVLEVAEVFLMPQRRRSQER